MLAAERIFISYPSRAYADLPAEVAVVKGFFKDEGIEPVLVQMRSQVAVPAMMNGDIQYTLTFGNIMTAALQGVPFKQLAVFTEKPLHHLVARPDIKTIADLKGKRVGTQRIGGSDYLAAAAILQAKGIDLKDVQFVTLAADEPVRLEILKKGLVDAICISPPGPIRLQKEGYNILGGPKDLKVGSPISGIATTDQRLKENRDQAKRVVRAGLRALRFVHERKDEVVPIMVRWLQQTKETASESYDLLISSFSPDGGVSDATYQFAVDARLKELKSDKRVPLSQLRDFSLLREVQKELKIQ
ncbi:MAG TPA: ABC transporter substrate-binding protein [Verrucomicrobiae bacterium]|nr:ABC transporter substrate-binding protein [Verrucomicrobiae bacterium]